MSVKDYSEIARENRTILDDDRAPININEGCPPGNINNAIRQMMADIKKWFDQLSSGNFTVAKATNADNATKAGSAERAANADYATRAGTADYATRAGTADRTSGGLIGVDNNSIKLDSNGNAYVVQQTTFLRGMIMPFWGNDAPAGWSFCDGSNGTPDLRNRVIVGARGDYGLGQYFGSDTHAHACSVQPRTLSELEMPYHTHLYSKLDYYRYTTGNSNDSNGYSVLGLSQLTQSRGAGGNQAHDHGFTMAGAYNIQQSCAVNYIMKL